MSQLLHVSPEEFLLDTFRLGRLVFSTGFRPKHVVSIWRGGTPVGLGIDAFFRSRGVFLDHTTVATESYVGIRRQGEVIVKGLDHVIDVVCREDGLLIVDDVLETGRTIQRILEVLQSRARANMPEEIRVATVHRKPDRLAFDQQIPVLTLHDLPGDVWIDYPHELSDLVVAGDDREENLRAKDPGIWDVLHGQEELVPGRIDTEAPYIYLKPRELLLDSLKLGLMVARDSSFRPDFLVALWPGGINTGLPLHEVLKYVHKKGLGPRPPDHISLTTARTRTSYRSDIVGIQYLVDHVTKDQNLLIVDTTFRSGQVVNDVLMKLKEALRRNLTLERVRVAAVYYNPTDQSTWTVPRAVSRPHYFVKKVEREIIYPQSVHKLARPQVELREISPDLHEVLYG